MTKTIAVITVSVTDEPLGDDTGSSGSRSVGNGHYVVVLRPNADKTIDPTLWKDKHSAESTLAHELGHIVAQIFHDPTHNPGFKLLAHMLDDESILVPGEKLAWNLAETISPNIVKSEEASALASYAGVTS